MAPSSRAYLFAVLIIVVTMGAAAESSAAASIIGEEHDGVCGDHLSGNYKGVCWGYWSNDNCNNVCITESNDNISGSCKLYKCWCQTRCASSEITGAAAAAPSIQP